MDRGCRLTAFLATCQSASEDNGANARLIAAAPDLLEAAREGLVTAEADVEARRRLIEEWGDYEPEDAVLLVLVARRDAIAAAIAKATTPTPDQTGGK
jgi:hypothetical protein